MIIKWLDVPQVCISVKETQAGKKRPKTNNLKMSCQRTCNKDEEKSEVFTKLRRTIDYIPEFVMFKSLIVHD